MFGIKNVPNSVIILAIIIVLAVIITGESIYHWQSKKAKAEVQKIEEEKKDLEEKVEGLKGTRKELEGTVTKEEDEGNEKGEDGESGSERGQNQITFSAGYIVVNSPQSGDFITSPVQITGLASVYEGTLNLKIKDAEGNVIAQDFTTCSLGAPGWGDFDTILNYSVSSPQQGTIEIYTTSAKDGSVDNIVSMSVNLK